NARSVASEGFAAVAGGISPARTRRRIFSQSARRSTIELTLLRFATFNPPDVIRSLWHCAQVAVRTGATSRTNPCALLWPAMREGAQTRTQARTAGMKSFRLFTVVFPFLRVVREASRSRPGA